MSIYRIIDILISNQAITVGVLVALLVFSVAVVINRKSGEFKKAVLLEKTARGNLTFKLLKQLDIVGQCTTKLLNQEKVVGAFNTRTISWCLVQTTKLAQISKYLDLLNKQSLEKRIRNCVEFQLDVLKEIERLEEQNYAKQKTYQEMVIFYDREYAKMREREVKLDNMLKIRKDIVQELRETKNELEKTLRDYKNVRTELAKRLHAAKSLNIVVQGEIGAYKTKNVDSKRFYIKHLVYV